MTPALIHSSRLCLRSFTDSDGPAVVAGLNNLAVSQWLARVPYPFTITDLKLMAPDGATRWPQMMAVTLNDAVIGAVSAGDHFGFWIAQEHWGQGYGLEAAKAALPVALQMSDSVESGYFVGNSASARILHALGFRIVHRGRTFCTALGRELPDVTLEMRATREAAA